MPRSQLDELIKRVDYLSNEINNFVPESNRNLEFRADLSGLFIVSAAATYESCVKEILIAHAGRKHPHFEVYAQNQYAKINSRISIGDLKRYAKTFNASIGDNFTAILDDKNNKIIRRTGKNIKISYENILEWRHAFAHSWSRITTLDEALKSHILAKRVIYAFAQAFESDSP